MLKKEEWLKKWWVYIPLFGLFIPWLILMVVNFLFVELISSEFAGFILILTLIHFTYYWVMHYKKK